MFPRNPLCRAMGLSAVLLLLQGCGNTQGPWGQYMKLLRQSVQNTMGDRAVTLEEAAAIPYATLGYRINGSDEAILVLATNTDGQLLWTAASHVVLLTQDGRVLRSVGLPRDRAFMTVQGGHTMPPIAAALKAPYRSVRIVDMPDIGTYAVPLTCNTSLQGAEMISILGTAMTTMRVDERCRSSNPSWTFTDSYWLDRTGFVWRSVQHLHPKGVRIETKILRPPE